MLTTIGVDSFDELIRIIPERLRTRLPLGLEDPLSELELINLAESKTAENRPSCQLLNFLGGGAYDHFIPQTVDFITGRSEFYTAYTPYQAEVSQGTLQAMYEYQSMICELSGLDVANASLYDGGSAVAEACSLSLNHTRKRRILFSQTLNPNYRAVADTYLQNRESEQVTIPACAGRTDLKALIAALDENTAAVVIQSPNYYGLVEDWTLVRSHLPANQKTMLIAVSDPLALPLLKTPGDCGADIYVGEGQPLGLPLSFGGPYLGLMAVQEKLVRRMPGRIIGRTVDEDGKEGYVLTLQTREQHIRRENATSNICTNQGLMALRATVYLALMGPVNLRRVAELCFNKAQYAADEIEGIDGYSLVFDRQFLKEFVVETPLSAVQLCRQADRRGLHISPFRWDSTDRQILLAFTEKRSRADIDRLIDFLKNPGL